MSTSAEHHWLYTWLDELDIQHVSDIDRVLDSPVLLADLHNRAHDSFSAINETPDPVASESAVVTGRTFDIATPYGCDHFKCQQERIKRAFLANWHYFDTLVLNGPDDGVILAAIEAAPHKGRLDYVKGRVSNAAALLLDLRRTGAAKHIEFRVKNTLTFCECCDLNDNLQVLGIGQGVDSDDEDRIKDEFRSNGDLVITKPEGKWIYIVRHPALPEPFVRRFGGNRKPTEEQALSAFVREVRIEMARDVQLSRKLGLPLCNEVGVQLIGSSTKPEGASREGIALNLTVPVPHGLDTTTLIRAMDENADQLIRFRAAIRKAIDEKMKHGGQEAASAGAEIVRDLIGPELADIERRIDIAKKTLKRKGAVNAGIGTAVVTVGLLTAMPLVVGVGVTALASQLVDTKKYLDDKSAVELSDMYFLWDLRKSPDN